MRYNPALDGLRAIAILLVLGCHTDVLKGGWIGVDVFFVLSGYLITNILLRELRETGSVDLGAFYTRRAFRLLPALAILCGFQVIRSWFSPNGPEIREATIIGALYLENWNNVFQFAPFDLMGHTWSLAVEEQFYLLWPLLLPFVFIRGLWWACATAGAVAIARVIYWHLGYAEPTIDFSMLRPVGLLVGCALAFGKWRVPAWAGTIALGVVLAIAVIWKTIYPVAPIMVSLATAVIVLGSPGWLTIAPLRYLGRISYGVYLYHWPLFMLGEKLKPPGSGHLWAIALIAFIFMVSALSYELIEKPILGLKGRFRRDVSSRAMPVCAST